MKIKNPLIIGMCPISTTNGLDMLDQYSQLRINPELEGWSKFWVNLSLSRDAVLFIRNRHKPFTAFFVSYTHLADQATLCVGDAESLLQEINLRPPTPCETIAIASQTIKNGVVRGILNSASQYRAVAAVPIIPESPTFYQFGVEGSLGSFKKQSHIKDPNNQLRFAGELDPVGFRWPVLIGIKDP